MVDNFLTVDDIAKELKVSRSYAYKIIRKLNKELKEQGYITISGRINSHYFRMRFYQNEKGE